MRSAGLDFQPGRLWSLWDMINREVFGLCYLLKQLLSEERDLDNRLAFIEASKRNPEPFAERGLLQTWASQVVDEGHKERLSGMLKFAGEIAGQIESSAARHRINLFSKKLGAISIPDLKAEIAALREAIEGDLQYRYFYYYPQNKAVVLLKVTEDWKAILDKFGSANREVFAAVDLWALGHDTASVFHLMRIAEHGLRALARERRVKIPKRPLEWADWQNIIDGIQKKADAIARRRRGPRRGAALEFYRGALTSFEGFKDAYRNDVMHTRKSYTEPEATAIRDHVHHFMNRLAEKTDETGKTINWKG
jgi:hypothetical protein